MRFFADIFTGISMLQKNITFVKYCPQLMKIISWYTKYWEMLICLIFTTIQNHTWSQHRPCCSRKIIYLSFNKLYQIFWQQKGAKGEVSDEHRLKLYRWSLQLFPTLSDKGMVRSFQGACQRIAWAISE